MHASRFNLGSMLCVGLLGGFLAIHPNPLGRHGDNEVDPDLAAPGIASRTAPRESTHRWQLSAKTAIGNPRATLKQMARMLESIPSPSPDASRPSPLRDKVKRMLDWMDEPDVIAALEQLDEASTDSHVIHQLRAMLSEHFARINGQHAMAYALSMPAEPHGALVASSAFATWADYDAQNAMTWASAQASSDQASMFSKKPAYYARRALHELREIDTRQAYARLHEILDPLNDSYVDLSALDPKIRNDIIASLKYLPTESKFKTMRVLLDRWASEDPQAAADFALSQDLSQDNKDHVRLGLAIGWAQQDPQQTLNWLVDHPGASASDPTLLTIYCAWLRHWPEEARGWLQQTDPETHALLRHSDPNLATAQNIADVMRVTREKRERENPDAP